MSSFFQKIHGTSSSAPPPTKKVRLTQSTARLTHPPQKFSFTALSQLHKPTQNTENVHPHVSLKERRQESTSVSSDIHTSSPRSKTAIRLAKPAGSRPMRRTQSSSDTSPTKKRKQTHLEAPKAASERGDSSSPAKENRQRTASPAFRLRRNSSDNETDFSEPVKLFRDSIEEATPMKRRMANPFAGQDVQFMHSKELVCKVDKECYVLMMWRIPLLRWLFNYPFQRRGCSP
jgi:hypothetical protein